LKYIHDRRIWKVDQAIPTEKNIANRKCIFAQVEHTKSCERMGMFKSRCVVLDNRWDYVSPQVMFNREWDIAEPGKITTGDIEECLDTQFFEKAG
jgi:hypothetical protein